MTSRRPPPPAEHVIRLRLPWKGRMALVGFVGFALICLFILIVDPAEWLMATLSILFSGGLALYAWGALPTEVSFGQESFTLRRRLLPDKQIAYREITGFGLNQRLVAQTGRFSWMQFENCHDVTRTFETLIGEGRISEAQLDDRAWRVDVAADRALLVAGWTMLVLVVIAFVFLWLGGLTGLSATLVTYMPFVIAAIVYPFVYSAYLRRLRQEDA